MKTLLQRSLLGVGAMLFVCTINVHAYNIVQTGITDKNDFVLDQAKIELKLKPGQSVSVPVSFTNRTSVKRIFSISKEDISGTQDGSEAVVLLGTELGKQTGKAFIIPEVEKFDLEAGERINMNVNVTLPLDVEPGGKYTSVVFANNSSEEGKGAVTVSRLASLFLIEVEGNAIKEGVLEDFKLNSSNFIFDIKPISYSILFRNTGNTHLDPFGKIEVTTLLGQVVEQIEIKPFYVMPDSLRNLSPQWTPASSFGIYNVKLVLNRGYDDMTDTKDFYIVLCSWQMLSIIVAGLFAIFLLYKYIFKNINISFKKN
jgi:hypothetical protein